MNHLLFINESDECEIQQYYIHHSNLSFTGEMLPQ